MAIRFTGKREDFDCVVCHANGPRARWSDGFWADVCTKCMEIFRTNCARLKTKTNPMWFLGRKSK